MSYVDQDSTATSNFHPALEALAAGLCPVPPKMDGSKAPIGTWKSFQHFPPDETQIRKWYSASHLTGYGLVTGKVSGNLELLEFDCITSYHRFKSAAAEAGLGDLVDRIEAGYSEQTPKPGIHWLYHCPEIAGNTELASRPKTAEEMKHPKDKVQVLIETRGEGGYVIVAPSNGKTHPSGGSYSLMAGGFSSIATITPDERRDLFTLARTFHVAPAAAKEQAEKDNVRNHRTHSPSSDGRWQVRPGDDFNARASWRELLEAQGWTFVYRQEERDYWRRPGKNQGVSACTNWEGKDYFYCFSTSTDFEAEKPIDKVGFHAKTMHGGNIKAAIRALAKAGYGTPAFDDDAETRTGTEKAKTEADRSGAESGAELKVFGSLNPTGLVGIATDEKSAAGIQEHSHIAVVVAGSAQRLWQAAQDMRRAHPRLKIVVCGDSDSADKARMAAFSLIGGSYWCAPNFLQPGRQELQDAAIALMKSPPAAGDEILPYYFKEATKALSARDQQRVAEESPSTFADLTGWESGAERVAQQIQAAIHQIGVIKIRPGKLPSIVDRAEKETLFYGADFYQRVGMLVRPVKQDVSTVGSVRIPAGALVLNLLNTSWLNRRFSQAAQWVKFNKETGEWLPADPPTKYADTLLAMAGEWRAPVLTGIVECPTLRRDGSLLTASGYDEESGLFVDYSGDPISVPNEPTQTDALAALAVLKEPFTEFPFAEGDIDLAVALSGLLTAVTRRSLRTAPLFAFDAPVMGAGKGLIVNTIAMVATGRAAPAISQGKDEAEDEKRLGALLLQGVPLLNIDNIERDLQGDLLCSALTETTIAIRILGKSEVPNMPSNVAMFATGNNLRARGDMVRRMLVCRIDPACERPDARSFKRNLNEWVPANRARLLSAALTVLRAYIVAGKPKQDIPPYGSFEEWSGLVRSSLVWLGMPDPNLTRARLEAEDEVTKNLHSILTLWFAAFGKGGMTAAEVATQAGLPGRDDLHRALLEVAVSKRDSEKVDAHRLGNWLKKNKGKVANRLRLEKVGEDTHSKMMFWRVVSLDSAKSAGTAGTAGTDSTETRENWKYPQNKSESNFSRDGREVYPQVPAVPANPPASPSVDSAFAGRDVEEF